MFALWKTRDLLASEALRQGKGRFDRRGADARDETVHRHRMRVVADADVVLLADVEALRGSRG